MSAPNSPALRSKAVTLWLGAPPSFRAKSSLIFELIDGLTELFRPYGTVESIWSSEPRTYRLSPKGRQALAEAIADQRIEEMQLDTYPDGDSGPKTSEA